MKIPVLSASTTFENEADIKTARAYVYWTPSTWMAARAEYYFDQLDDSNATIFSTTTTTITHRAPLGLNLFHPSGFFAKLDATYIRQYGTFLNVSSGNFEPGDDTFWVCDASIGYRLPKRFGILTIGGANLFNQGFKFQELDPANPLIQPKRLFFTKVTFAF